MLFIAGQVRAAERCILDLGCMDYNAAVIISIFIAKFCSNVSLSDLKEQSHKIIKEYTKIQVLNKDEINALPVLIVATFAMYTLAPNYLQVVKKDSSKHTNDWLAYGRNSLKKFHLLLE